MGRDSDATALDETRASLLMADRMASMGQLAAGVAHEINNPLTFICANIDFAMDALRQLAKDPEKAPTLLTEIQEVLQEARQGTDRVRDIVRDLKTFSRSDERKSGPVDLRRVMESSIHMAWNEIRYRARLTKEYGNLPPVYATESRLGQVFLNLLINAAQSIREGDVDNNEIRVVTRSADDGRVVVEISDTGQGIPPEHRERLFKPFFTSKPMGVGTGLGLTICHSIVTELRGEIEVDSEVGRGSVFRVLLPESRMNPEKHAEATVEVAGRRAHVLLIDDEEALVRAVERMLSSKHDVVGLVNAREALELIEAGERFDVILCDLIMPDMTGMDFYAKLINVAPEQIDNIIFLTGGAFTPSSQAFLDEVPNLRLEKPFDTRNLMALLHKLVR